MRATNSDITTAMHSATRTPYAKVSIVTAEHDSSPTVEDFTTGDRLVFLNIPEEGYGVQGTIILAGHDGHFNTKNYVGRRIRTYLGYTDAGLELQPFWIISQNHMVESGRKYLMLGIENLFSRMTLDPSGTYTSSAPNASPKFNAILDALGATVEHATSGLESIEEIIKQIFQNMRPSGFTSSNGVLLNTKSLTGTDGDNGTTTNPNGDAHTSASASTDELADSGADSFAGVQGVRVGDRLLNLTDHTGGVSSEAVITAVSGDTIGHDAVLVGGAGNNWEQGDNYSVVDALFYGRNDALNLTPMISYRWGTPALSLVTDLMDMTYTRLRMKANQAGVEAVYVTPSRVGPTVPPIRYDFGGSGRIVPTSLSIQYEVVRPNRVFVIDKEPGSGGNATNQQFTAAVADDANSQGRYGVLAGLDAPKNDDMTMENQEEVDDRAAALLHQIQTDAGVALFTSPVNPHIELYDHISVTSFGLTAVKGYANKIEWNLCLDSRLGPVRYDMEVHIGGIRKYMVSNIVNNMGVSQIISKSTVNIDPTTTDLGRLTDDQLLDLIHPPSEVPIMKNIMINKQLKEIERETLNVHGGGTVTPNIPTLTGRSMAYWNTIQKQMTETEQAMSGVHGRSKEDFTLKEQLNISSDPLVAWAKQSEEFERLQ